MEQTGEPMRILRSATTGGWPVGNLSITASLAAKAASYVLLQYPTLLSLVGVVAVRVKPPRRSDTAIMGAIIAVAATDFVFAARYPVPDQYAFFLPCYASFSLLIGLGAWKAISRWPWARLAGVALAITPIIVNAALPSLVRHFAPHLYADQVPYRDHYKAYFQPWQQGNYDARPFCKRVFQAAPRDAVLFYDFMVGSVLVYMSKVEGTRPDLRLIPAWHHIPLSYLTD